MEESAYNLALSALFAGVGTPQDSGIVNDVAKALDASNLKTIQYSGSGYAYAFGQSYLPGGPYPKFYAKYSRAIDFDQESFARRNDSHTI